MRLEIFEVDPESPTKKRSVLEALLTKMNVQEIEQFNRQKGTLSEALQIELGRKIVSEAKAVRESFYQPACSADDHRTKAKAHQDRADELKAGEKKDLNTAAAKAHTDAADAIDKANQSSAKAALLD
jgi:hypothetical protein